MADVTLHVVLGGGWMGDIWEKTSVKLWEEALSAYPVTIPYFLPELSDGL